MPPKKRKGRNEDKEGKPKRLKVRNIERHWALIIEDGEDMKGRVVGSRRKSGFNDKELRGFIGCDTFTILAMGKSKMTRINFEIYVDDEALLVRNNKENKLLELLIGRGGMKGKAVLLSKDATLIKRVKNLFGNDGRIKDKEKRNVLLEWINIESIS